MRSIVKKMLLLCVLVGAVYAAPVDTVDLLGGLGRFNERHTGTGWTLYAQKASAYQVSVKLYSDSIGYGLVIKSNRYDDPSYYAQAKIELTVPHGSRLMPRGNVYSAKNHSLYLGFENTKEQLYGWAVDVKGSTNFSTGEAYAFDFCSANHKAEKMYFYINGGHAIWEVVVPWVIIDMVPIECPGDSAYADSVARASEAEVAYNYLGYNPNASKRIVLKSGIASDVYFKNTAGDSVFGVTPAKPAFDALSGDTVQIVDFSELKTPGNYTVWQGSSKIHRGVKIGENSLDTVLMEALAFFYSQRASAEIAGNGVYRSKGHPDNPVVLHTSLGENGTIGASEGWYDGADYGKYVVNAGITVYTLLSLYEHYPEYLKELDWGLLNWGKISDLKKREWPNILNEVWYELRWLLRMRSKSGGVYHKLTSLEDPAYNVLPDQDTLPRFVIGKSAAASYDFAAVMATASRIYREYDEAFADTCLNAAKVAFEWADEHQDALFTENPFGVSTKPYADSIISDERQFAMTELAITTKDKKYIAEGASVDIPNWQNVYGLATYGKATHAELFGNLASVAKSYIVKKADALVERTKSGYGVTLAESDFVRGSNGIAANQAIWLLHAYYVTGENKYLAAASTVIDYFFGCNPTQNMYVTYKDIINGNSVMPYHRISSGASYSRNAIYGMLLNGPEKVENGVELGYGRYIAKSIRGGDSKTAEVSIDKNAALAYLLGSMIALEKGLKPEFMESSIKLPLVDVPDSLSGEHTTVVAGKNLRYGSSNDVRKIWFDGHSLYVKKVGIRYNLKGKRIGL